MGGMFNGGFQIMTWGSELVTLLLSRLGPRSIGAAGALMATAGSYSFYAAGVDSETWVFMLSFGLVGLGMNSVYISLMSGLTGLFRNPELYVTVLAGIFNASGAMLMITMKVIFTCFC